MVYNLFPETEVILNKMGEQIKMARMRRNIPAELMAEQAGISRSTLHKIEAGSLRFLLAITHLYFICWIIWKAIFFLLQRMMNAGGNYRI